MPNETSLDPKSRARRNKYLLKKFSITLDDKEHREALQRGLCPVCGGPLDAHGPSNVDHYHAHIDVVRTESPLWAELRLEFKWEAWMTDEKGQRHFIIAGKTKAGTLRTAKAKVMPGLIRAILCAKCNKGLGYIERFFDAARHPENLDAIKAYFLRRIAEIS